MYNISRWDESFAKTTILLFHSADGEPFLAMTVQLQNLVYHSIMGDPGNVVNHVKGVEGGNGMSNLNVLTQHQNTIPIPADVVRVLNRSDLNSVTQVLGVSWKNGDKFYTRVSFNSERVGFCLTADKTLKENDMFTLVICLVARVKLEK